MAMSNFEQVWLHRPRSASMAMSNFEQVWRRYRPGSSSVHSPARLSRASASAPSSWIAAGG